MTHGLSKSRLQALRQCPKRLWLTVHHPDLQDVSEATEEQFQIGFQVGDIARSLHPDGILIDTPDAAEALALTRRVLAEQPDRPLFEATFQRDGVLVRADLLQPEFGGYRLREVKAWREMYHSDTSAERRAKLRAALAEYCHRDTLALVRLAGFLAKTQPEWRRGVGGNRVCLMRLAKPFSANNPNQACNEESRRECSRSPTPCTGANSAASSKTAS